MSIGSNIPFEELSKKASIFEETIGISSDPFIITKEGKPIGILQNLEGYQKMHKAIQMLKIIALGEADIKKDKVKNHDEVFESLKKKIQRKND
jgi:hypothetical protein